MASAAAVLAAGPALGAGFEGGLSSTTKRLIEDLETLSEDRPSPEGLKSARAFFDADGRPAVTVKGPFISARRIGNPLSPGRRGGGVMPQPFPPRLGPLHRGSFRGVPPPPNFHPGYNPYMPPPRYGHGDNALTRFVNNARDAVARWIAPDYPYPTRYVSVDSWWGRQEVPVYRYRSGPFDIPAYSPWMRHYGPGTHYGGQPWRPMAGYPADPMTWWQAERAFQARSNGFPPGFRPGYGFQPPPNRPGYGYSPGFGYFPLSDDGGRRAMSGLPGYDYYPGHGYVEQGANPDMPPPWQETWRGLDGRDAMRTGLLNELPGGLDAPVDGGPRPAAPRENWLVAETGAPSTSDTMGPSGGTAPPPEEDARWW